MIMSEIASAPITITAYDCMRDFAGCLVRDPRVGWTRTAGATVNEEACCKCAAEALAN